MNAIYDLRDMLCDELEQVMTKNTNMNLDQIDKLTHALKSVETIIAMKEGGYSTTVHRDGYNDNSYYSGNSYRNGRYGGMRYNENYNSYRMSNGRNSGYSRHDGKEDMIANLHDMLNDATSTKEKDAIHQCIEKLQNM